MPNISDIEFEDSIDNNQDEISIVIDVLPEVSENTIYNVLFKNELD